MTQKISMDKKYRTRDGRGVILYEVDVPCSAYPVKGRICGERCTAAWPFDGIYSKDREGKNDLVEVKPRIKGRVWLNIWRDGNGDIQVADTGFRVPAFELPDSWGWPTSQTVALIPVDIDCEEGEGL